MALDPSKLKPGCEQWEKFQSRIGRNPKTLYQYDYRDIDGKLVSAVASTLELAKEKALGKIIKEW